MSDKEFVSEVVEASNKYRARHHARPLKLNHHITKISQAWADHLAKVKVMSHNPNPIYKRENMGENIAMHYNSNKSAEYPGH